MVGQKQPCVAIRCGSHAGSTPPLDVLPSTACSTRNNLLPHVRDVVQVCWVRFIFCTKQSYGAVYFEPIPEAALVLDIGARFLHGAICDLSGTVLACQNVKLREAHVEEALSSLGGLRDSLLATIGFSWNLVYAATGSCCSPPICMGSSGGVWPTISPRNLALLPIRLKNDIKLTTLGEQWPSVARHHCLSLARHKRRKSCRSHECSVLQPELVSVQRVRSALART